MTEDSNPEALPADTSTVERAWAVIAGHPIIVAVLVGCTLLGIALGVAMLPEDWALARRIMGGAVGGAGCGLIFTAPRIIG